jgi:hypothetical protein
MFVKRFLYKLSKVIQTVDSKLGGIEINWGYWIFTAICLLSIVLLAANILRIFKKGYERYEIIQQEKERLEALIERNIELQEDLKYYSSTEYVDIKAREELNLAFPNQRLVYIEKKEDYEIDTSEKDGVFDLEPSWELWYDLIF